MNRLLFILFVCVFSTATLAEESLSDWGDWGKFGVGISGQDEARLNALDGSNLLDYPEQNNLPEDEEENIYLDDLLINSGAFIDDMLNDSRQEQKDVEGSEP